MAVKKRYERISFIHFLCDYYLTMIFCVFAGTMIGFIAIALKVMGVSNIIYQSLCVITIVFGVSTVSRSAK